MIKVHISKRKKKGQREYLDIFIHSFIFHADINKKYYYKKIEINYIRSPNVKKKKNGNTKASKKKNIYLYIN